MKRLLYLICFLVLNVGLLAQSRWEDHFNYAQVKEIHQLGDKLYCVSSNAIFTYNLTTNELEKISKVNLLNGVKPSSAAYNSELDYLLIGYENGELDLLGEQSQNFIEIPLDNYTGSKKINHIATQGNLMLISAAYGVSLFDLDRREFAETAFFRENSVYKEVYESEIFDNKIYAAYQDGIKFHAIDQLIPNYNGWSTANGLPQQAFQHIQKFNDFLLASSGGSLYVLQNGTWSQLANFAFITDLNVNENHLIVSTQNQIYVYNASLQVVENRNFNNLEIQSGIYTQNNIYAGTQAHGLVSAENQAEYIYPDGPYSNNAYGVSAQDGHVWLAPGGQDNYNQPTGNTEGYSHFNGTEWKHVSSELLNGAKDIIHVTYNPQDLNQAFASAWHYNYNFYEITNDDRVREYNYQNTGSNGIIENPYSFGQVTNLGGSAFDNEGNLYITQGFIDPSAQYSALIKRTPNNQWSNIRLNAFHNDKPGVTKPVVGRDGYVWMGGTRGDGVMVTNMTNTYQLLSGESHGDLPSNNVYALAVDQNGTAWIGTQLGLRVLSNPITKLESGNFDTEPIVIIQNGIPEALLTDTAIKDIAVDSSNRKWIATAGAGVFYVSESGTEVLLHFTEDISPLVSNTVNAVAVDSKTGKVYFATEYGLVSYKGDAVDTGDGFGEVLAYPNPVRPGYQGDVTIKGLAKDTEVRITDVVGNLIYKDQEAGGVVLWDQTNLKGEKVASGIYIVMLIAGDGMDTRTTKIAIVR